MNGHHTITNRPTNTTPVMQINANRSITALSDLLDLHQPEIVILQEPPKTRNYTTNCYNLFSVKENPRTAIMVSKSIKATLRHAARDTVSVEITQKHQHYLLSSVYLHKDITPSDTLELIPCNLTLPHLIGCDANAKSELWNSPPAITSEEKNRAQQIESWLMRHNLLVINSLQERQPASRRNIRSQTYIDFTAVNGVCVQEWHVSMHSLSDHRPLLFKIKHQEPVNDPDPTLAFSRTNTAKLENLLSEIQFQEFQQDSIDSINEAISIFTGVLKQLLLKTTPKAGQTQTTPWLSLIHI